MKKLRYLLYRFKQRLTSLFHENRNEQKQFGWFGDYSSWSVVKNECSGYEAANILNTVKSSVIKVRNGEAVYERDSVLFDEVTYSPHLIEVLESSINNGKLHVVDFGGSLGSSYFQHRNLFQDLIDFRWSVVEQSHFVEFEHWI